MRGCGHGRRGGGPGSSLARGLLERRVVARADWRGGRDGSWLRAVLLSADVFGVAGMSLGSLNVLKVAALCSEVGQEVVGAGAIGEG